ncbi:hypothetical protein BN946_scf184777.g2 [Trametes cinnabarina]|uniref:Uncharacterized protein n=1 Tax=Pycnoporus cinnabarinus TaxID=5643 RepID=A0A060S3H7_PYCCI|nr:hypothetical protein BN946_scf184777.g2 [Trametes cinnabarina]
MIKSTKGRRASVGRFLLDVIKPNPTLGKRAREDDSDGLTKTMRRASRSQPLTSTTPAVDHNPACIALQNEDAEEDAIVITALNVVPFCCHADLVTMNRAQLLGVADCLNRKLPRAMQIDTSASRSDAFIRNSVELLVGLRKEMPQASKRAYSRSVYETPRIVPSSPASPLAGRSRSNMSLGTPALAMLREEDEGHSRESEGRPQKRRRMAPLPSTPTLDPRRPITRSQSHRVAPLVTNAQSPSTNPRVLRTRSQKLPERMPLYPVNAHANVTVTRGRSVTRGKDGYSAKRASFAMTSTPKKRALAAVNSPESGSPRFRAILAGMPAARGGRERRSSRLGDESADMDEFTFGIDGLTMPPAEPDCSDMDITSG